MSRIIPRLGIHRLVPASLLAGRWLLVLSCYLDDSGKDPQSRITSIGGYIAREQDWEAFEAQVERWFTEFGVDVLHAKELHDTDGPFHGWKKLRKHAFISRVYQEMRDRIPMGFAASAVKDAYELGVTERSRHGLRTVRPYTFCFNVIVDMVLSDRVVGKEANTDGVAFFIETGHEHNPEAEAQFHDIRERHGLQDVLRSISFIGKKSCRAIQVADLLAFYSRRHGAALEHLSPQERVDAELDTIVKIMIECVPHRTWVADKFGPNVPPNALFLRRPS